MWCFGFLNLAIGNALSRLQNNSVSVAELTWFGGKWMDLLGVNSIGSFVIHMRNAEQQARWLNVVSISLPPLRFVWHRSMPPSEPVWGQTSRRPVVKLDSMTGVLREKVPRAATLPR